MLEPAARGRTIYGQLSASAAVRDAHNAAPRISKSTKRLSSSPDGSCATCPRTTRRCERQIETSFGWLDRPMTEALEIALAARDAEMAACGSAEMETFDGSHWRHQSDHHATDLEAEDRPVAIGSEAPARCIAASSWPRSPVARSTCLGGLQPAIVSGCMDREWAAQRRTMRETDRIPGARSCGGRSDFEGVMSVAGFRIRHALPQARIASRPSPAMTRVAARPCRRGRAEPFPPPTTSARSRDTLDAEARCRRKGPIRVSLSGDRCLEAGAGALPSLASKWRSILAPPVTARCLGDRVHG